MDCKIISLFVVFFISIWVLVSSSIFLHTLNTVDTDKCGMNSDEMKRRKLFCEVSLGLSAGYCGFFILFIVYYIARLRK